MVTMEAWMFLSSYEKFRESILNNSILSLVHMPYDGKGRTSMGINFGTSATSIQKINLDGFRGNFNCIRYYEIDQHGTPHHFPVDNERLSIVAVDDFKKIPGSPIAYWVSSRVREIFEKGIPIGEKLTFKQGIATSDNERFLRYWHEVDFIKMDHSCSSPIDLKNSQGKWFPYNKGGNFRKWYGNNEYLVNWEKNGQEMKDFTSTLSQGTHVRLKSREFYCLPCITYSALSSSSFGCRISGTGFLFDTKGSCIFGEKNELQAYSGLLNSRPAKIFLDILCPTLDYSMVGIKQIPFVKGSIFQNNKIVNEILKLTKIDWDSYETSWLFTTLPIVQPKFRQPDIRDTYTNLRSHWNETTTSLKLLEEDNNKFFIEDYNLQNELNPDVSLKEITLTCNPYFRYGNDKNEEELESLLLADTIKELISYSVGCIMGRYSLDKSGLVYAHSGNEGFDASNYKTFPVDDDGIITLPDTEDLMIRDDIVSRFTEFLIAVWGKESLSKNLRFVADTLGSKTDELPKETIRRWLSTDFLKDHLKRYKNRPIYWLFSSGKKKAFEALVYLHRYNESTLSRMRMKYVVPLQTRISDQLKTIDDDIDSATGQERTRLTRKKKLLGEKEVELRKYDETLRHLAEQQIKLDLDDGVKVNYGKFPGLLAETKKVCGK